MYTILFFFGTDTPSSCSTTTAAIPTLDDAQRIFGDLAGEDWEEVIEYFVFPNFY